MIKAVFFDLDGTLLPLNEDEFTNIYFNELHKTISHLGYEKKQMIDTIWTGTKLMYKNDGSKTNEEVFWNYFISVYGKDSLEHKKYFDTYYTNEFKKTKSVCKENPYAREIIDYLKKKNIDAVLTTNPIFPLVAVDTRMRFIDLKKEDFKYITSYENSKFTKPNPYYFIEVLNKLNLKPDEVILFGNNTYEDLYCANKAGIKCYIVGDYVIENENVSIDYEHIKMNEVIKTIEKELGAD